MKKLISIVAIVLLLSGCSSIFEVKNNQVYGKKTGINYTVVYKIFRNGAIEWVDSETLAKYHADDIDMFITNTYKYINEGNDVDSKLEIVDSF